MAVRVYLAIDLGAGSGRVMAGLFDGRVLRFEEVNRFANTGVQLPTGWHWNTTQLFGDIVVGLGLAGKRWGGALRSVAVDTWGVDYGLIDAGGRLLGLPWMYRDARTDGMVAAAEAVMPFDEMYRRTGIQRMVFNTIYQLMAEARSHPQVVAAAEQILFMPDLLTFWLSGERVIERTIASTSQLLRAGTNQWDTDLARAVGIPPEILRPLTEPATTVGALLPHLAGDTGCADLRVVACGAHDTASAVAAVPASGASPLFLSSGTWSLLGRELGAPMVTARGAALGFSNEQGLSGTTRLLKNIAGMWLVQECKRQWDTEGPACDFGELVTQAAGAEAVMFLDPDAEEFARPCDMPAAICAYARRTGQREPRSRGEFARTIFESLALKYRWLIECLRAEMPDLPDTLHVVGGGCRNALLNQMTADATGLHVVAGPVEATAAGNIIAQLMAEGEISSVAEGREIVRRSFEPTIIEPKHSASWDDKAAHFQRVTGLPDAAK